MLSRSLFVGKLLVRRPAKVNVYQARCSGHNTMEITPSHFIMNKWKDMLHLYTMLAAIPTAVITVIANIRANPELAEIPEGYEPRHWEYYRNPISRWIAKYWHNPPELEHEIIMANFEKFGEEHILRKMQDKVEKTMVHYNDHRSKNFKPFYAEYFRRGRDDMMYGQMHMKTEDSGHFERAYDPSYKTMVPVEGYKPSGPQSK